MKIERYAKHTVGCVNDIFYYYIFAPELRFQITTYNDGRFKDTNFLITDLAKYANTEHFNHLVFVYCIPNPNKSRRLKMAKTISLKNENVGQRKDGFFGFLGQHYSLDRSLHCFVVTLLRSSVHL